MSVGYIYILSNSTMGGLLKIGFTCGGVESRAMELSAATGVPGEFVVEYFHLTEDVELAERMVHEELAEYRHNIRREFFSAPLLEAVLVIERHVKKPLETFVLAPQTLAPTIPPYICRRCGASYAKSDQQRYCPKCEF